MNHSWKALTPVQVDRPCWCEGCNPVQNIDLWTELIPEVHGCCDKSLHSAWGSGGQVAVLSEVRKTALRRGFLIWTQHSWVCGLEAGGAYSVTAWVQRWDTSPVPLQFLLKLPGRKWRSIISWETQQKSCGLRRKKIMENLWRKTPSSGLCP